MAQREREIDRQTDRRTDGRTHGRTDGRTDRHWNRDRNWETERGTEKKTETHRESRGRAETDRHTGRQTGHQKQREIERQSNRETQTHRQRETEGETTGLKTETERSRHAGGIKKERFSSIAGRHRSLYVIANPRCRNCHQMIQPRPLFRITGSLRCCCRFRWRQLGWGKRGCGSWGVGGEGVCVWGRGWSEIAVLLDCHAGDGWKAIQRREGESSPAIQTASQIVIFLMPLPVNSFSRIISSALRHSGLSPVILWYSCVTNLGPRELSSA